MLLRSSMDAVVAADTKMRGWEKWPAGDHCIGEDRTATQHIPKGPWSHTHPIA
jgi:hypothetical protein